VLLDAMGTLLTFEPPAPHLRAAVRERLGADVSEQQARAAIAAEIAYYRAHIHEGGDEAGLAALRRASAEAMREPLGLAGADAALLTAALLDSLRFRPFAEVPGALRLFRAAGVRLVVVSNWDVSLHERLEETGLAPLLDGAVASAQLGAAKPDRAIFARGLELAGVRAEQALHVGDSPREDVEGALAAGITPVLLAREGAADVPAGVRAIRALDELRVP
jgi:putative hydrolase of the HAD superfamily